MCNLEIASGNLYRTKMHRIRRKKPIKKRVIADNRNKSATTRWAYSLLSRSRSDSRRSSFLRSVSSEVLFTPCLSLG